MCQVDVLLGINSTRSVYWKTATAVLVKVLLFCVVVGILHTFDYGLWYRGRYVLYGLSKYVTNNVRLLMVIHFVNFVHNVKTRFKMINSEIIRIFGLRDDMEMDEYLVYKMQWLLTKPQGADINRSRRTKICISELNRSEMMDELR